MFKSLSKIHRKISQKTRQLSQKKLNLSIKRRKMPAQGFYPEEKQEIMIFDTRHPATFTDSTESFNPVQEYAHYPRNHNPDEYWKLNRSVVDRYDACQEPNVLDPMEQYDQQGIPIAMVSRRHKCRGCCLPFNFNTLTISSPDEVNPIYCIGCERLFASLRHRDIHERFDPSTNMIRNNPLFETHFLNDLSMHPHHNCGSPYDNRYEVFHLPYSPNYYRRYINQRGQITYVLCDVQPVIQDRYLHFYQCNGCRQFTEYQRSPIYYATVSIAGEYRMATHKEVLTFLSYNMTCMYTGLQGCWTPTGKEFFSLQLELKTPIEYGGRGFLDNLKVSLVGIDSLLETFDVEDVQRWVQAVKGQQGR